DSGAQSRPALVMLPGNETAGVWTDRTDFGGRSEVRVTAQVVATDTLPLDIDFDVGRSRIPVRPVGDQGADPVPHIAGGGGRYAVVWEAPGGIKLQVLRSGPY